MYRINRVKGKEETSTESNNHSLNTELRELKEKNLLRNLRTIESKKAPLIKINKRELIDFSSNDYLNLSSHPAIIKAVTDAMNRYGFGSGASRLLSGCYSPHKRLEDKIAAFKETEASIVFNTGYAANTGTIPSITGEGDLIFSDELNHASIIDGVRLSKAALHVYRHRDLSHLESLLKKRAVGTIGNKLIVTDTVFSMDGDIAPLKDLHFLSSKYGATLMIDDAHGTGVIGENGRGALERFCLKGDDIIQMGTLSKAAGCFGAFVAGSRDLIDYLINRARSFIYSTSLPPAVAHAGIASLDIIDKRSVRLRNKLWKNRERLYDGLNKLGYNTLGSETPIIPVLIGDTKKAVSLGEYLYENSIFAPAIRPPTVPEGKSRLRFTVTAAHSNEDIDLLLDIMRRD